LKKDIESWLEQKCDHAQIRLKTISEDDLKAELSIGPSFSFELFFPSDYPNSDDPLSVYADGAELAEWNMMMLEFCEQKHKLSDLLNQSVKIFNSTRKKPTSSSSKKQPTNEFEEQDVLEFHMEKAETTSSRSNSSSSGPKPNPNAKKVDPLKFFTGAGSKSATNRIIQDLNAIYASSPEKFGYSAEPVGDDLYRWEVKLFGFEDACHLKSDLERLKRMKGITSVLMDMKFPSDYPFSPPFLRVVRPRFQFHTGHVTIGGSICMELLTRSGWSPGNDIESILIQIRSEMISGNARIDFERMQDYTEEEARSAFERVARQHGWN